MGCARGLGRGLGHGTSSSHGPLPGALLAHGQNNRYGTGADKLGSCDCRLLEAAGHGHPRRPAALHPPGRPSKCSPGSPRPPTGSSATVPPPSSPAQPTTAPA